MRRVSLQAVAGLIETLNSGFGHAEWSLGPVGGTSVFLGEEECFCANQRGTVRENAR